MDLLFGSPKIIQSYYKMITLFIFFLFIPFNLYAQMSVPSVFPDMKSANPAVISLRKSGIVKISVGHDQIERKQELKTLNGSPFSASQVDDIKITNFELFRGGKGSGATTEWLVDYTTGKQNTSFKSNSFNTEYSISSQALFTKYAIGLPSKSGLELHYVRYTSDYSFDQIVDNATEKTNISSEISLPGVRIGKTFGPKSFSLGFIGEVNFFSNKLETNSKNVQSGSPSKTMTIAGAGIGSGGNKSSIEASIELDLTKQEADPQTGEKPATPMKASFMAEAQIWGLILGYKGILFKGLFIDFENIIPQQMVYNTLEDESRLQHIINFMLKPSKGFSFGGNVMYSNVKTEQKSSLYKSKDLHDTTIKSFGFGINLGYVW